MADRPAGPPPSLEAAFAAHLRGDLRAALDEYAALLDAQPAHPDALRLMRRLAEHLGHTALAAELAAQAAALPPPDPVTSLREGLVCLAHGRRMAARACLEAAAASPAALPPPALAEALHGLGLLAMGDRRPEVAADLFERAVALVPGHARGWANLGAARRRLGDVDGAIAALERAVALAPGLAEARCGLGQALLLAGRGRAGFAAYEARWQLPGAVNLPAAQDRPLWDGRIDPARTLLLYAEQGLGDMVLAARFAARLHAAGQPLCLEMPEPLVPPLARALSTEGDSGAGVSVIARGAPRPPHAMQAPLLSVPALAGWDLAQAAGDGRPYLTAEPARLAAWRHRLGLGLGLGLGPAAGERRQVVGLVWQGDVSSPAGADRSLPLALLAPLARPGVRLLAVQRGPAAAEADHAPFAVERPDDGALHADALEDSLALMALCDHVVSVDTLAAHLAGALGRPGSVLLRHDPAWPWAASTAGRSLWHPTLRLFRQPARGAWEPAVAALAAALAASPTAGPVAN